MSKLLKIGIPVMVLVFVLGIGTGLILAKGNDASVLTGTTVAYADYAGCSQCPGVQYAGCPCAGNGSGYCAGQGAGCGQGGLSGGDDDKYQPPCHRCR
jgi:hypothetical protein